MAGEIPGSKDGRLADPKAAPDLTLPAAGQSAPTAPGEPAASTAAQAAAGQSLSAGATPEVAGPPAAPISDAPSLPTFQSTPSVTEANALGLLNDVELDVSIELGRTQLRVEEVLKLCDNAVVELDKLAGDPVDVYVNERLVARGEVLVLNDNFCVRVNEIVAPDGNE